MRGRARPAGLLVAVAGLVLGLGACSDNSATSYGSALSRQRIDNDAVQVMNRKGMPVDFDDIGCHMSGRKMVCYDETSDTPQKPVTAVFGPPSGGPGCPGQLHVILGATTVKIERENPCR